MRARSLRAINFTRIRTEPVTIDMSHVPTWWYGPKHIIFDELRAGKGCSVKCDARWHWSHPAMVALQRMAPPSRQVNQITAVETGEPQLDHMMDRFLSADVTVSSDLYSDVFNIPYSPKWGERFFGMPPPKLADFETIYYSGVFVSNCIQPRLKWIEDIGAEIPIISYGRCAHTKGSSCPRNTKCNKIEEGSKYPFAIAFENHPMQGGYVSEKIFHAFASNSLPVVWSAIDVAEYTPGLDSFINAADFETPTDLARYLKTVRGNSTLYNSYFRWRHNATRVEETKTRWQQSGGGKAAVCGICEFVTSHGI